MEASRHSVAEVRGKWKKYKEKSLRRGRRWSGWEQAARTKSNGFYLPVISAGIELFAIELEGDSAGVSGFDDDLFAAADNAFAAGFQKFGRGCFAVGGDRDPGFFAGMDDNRKLAGKCGGG